MKSVFVFQVNQTHNLNLSVVKSRAYELVLCLRGTPLRDVGLLLDDAEQWLIQKGIPEDLHRVDALRLLLRQ